MIDKRKEKNFEDAICKLLNSNPNLTAAQVSKVVGCSVNHVQVIAKSYSLPLQSKPSVTLPRVSFLEREVAYE